MWGSPLADVHELTNLPDGFEFKVGDLIFVEQNLVAPFGTYLVDLENSAADLGRSVQLALKEEGVDAGFNLFKSGHRELGPFAYKRWATLRIGAITTPKDVDPKFQQAAIPPAVLVGLIAAAVSLVAVGWTTQNVARVARDAPESLSNAASAVATVAVAAAAIVLLVVVSKQGTQ